MIFAVQVKGNGEGKGLTTAKGSVNSVSGKKDPEERRLSSRKWGSRKNGRTFHNRTKHHGGGEKKSNKNEKKKPKVPGKKSSGV